MNVIFMNVFSFGGFAAETKNHKKTATFCGGFLSTYFFLATAFFVVVAFLVVAFFAAGFFFSAKALGS
jgi:hypothetical protein